MPEPAPIPATRPITGAATAARRTRQARRSSPSVPAALGRCDAVGGCGRSASLPSPPRKRAEAGNGPSLPPAFPPSRGHPESAPWADRPGGAGELVPAGCRRRRGAF